MTATTALTAQNTKGVYGIHEVPVDFLRKQIDAVVEDVGVDVVKTGEPLFFVMYKTYAITNNFTCIKACLLRLAPLMLLRKPFMTTSLRHLLLIRYVFNIKSFGLFTLPLPLFASKSVTAHHSLLGQVFKSTPCLERPTLPRPFVNHIQLVSVFSYTLYQVMVATTGAELLPNSAAHALREKLLPLATILTPNVPEANTFLLEAGHDQHPVQSVADLEAIALKVQKLGSKWVLVKGGHSPFRKDGTEAKTEDDKEIVVNILVGPAAATDGTKRDAEGEEKLQVVKIEMPYHRSRNTHGTGCSLACELSLSYYSRLIEEPESG